MAYMTIGLVECTAAASYSPQKAAQIYHSSSGLRLSNQRLCSRTTYFVSDFRTFNEYLPAVGLLGCRTALCWITVFSDDYRSAVRLLGCRTTLCWITVFSNDYRSAVGLLGCRTKLCWVTMFSDDYRPIGGQLSCSHYRVTSRLSYPTEL